MAWNSNNPWQHPQAAKPPALGVGIGTVLPPIVGSLAPKAAPAAPAINTDPNTGLQSADAEVAAYLASWGLNDDALVSQLWNDAKSGQNHDMLMLNLRQSAAYKQRFNGMAQLQANGESLNEQQYLGLESALRQTLQPYLPQGAITNEYLGTLIGNQVSVSEAQARLNDYQTVVNDISGDTKNYLRSAFGINDQDLMHFWMDPAQAEPMIHQKVAAAQIGAAAHQVGYNGIVDPTTALQLAGMGVSQQQAQAGFGKVAQAQDLTKNYGQGAVTNDQLIGAEVAGNGSDADQVQKTAATRVAQFTNGGSFAGNAQGNQGLRSANDNY